MKFIKTPVKGMPEQLPQDMILREFVLKKIKENYKKFGFSLINTPMIEHIENLTNKQGGENEQLIFKILKRGEKLEQSNNIDQICDCGLRYDLTVPLSRFYANNHDKLCFPFKVLQIGEAFRADRPQKGRFRQFTQCDIDIIGDDSNLAEIELISATVNMLNELGIDNVKIRINDREILKAMALSCGFPEDKLNTVYIILDKFDKIGVDGVKESLSKIGITKENIDKYIGYLTGIGETSTCNNYLEGKTNGFISDEVISNLDEVIQCVSQTLNNNSKIVFDPTLVRGMSYYTGPIFEIELQDYHLSVAGGGRYDKMIGKFIGKDVCACGFSIGLERIISTIKDNDLISLPKLDGIAVLINKNVEMSKVQDTIIKVNQMRKDGKTVLITTKSKNVSFQKEKLSQLGYIEFIEIFNDKGLDESIFV